MAEGVGPASFYLPIFTGYQRLEILIDGYRREMMKLIAPHLSPNKPVSRMLLPSDVGLNTVDYEFALNAGTNEIINYQVPDNKAITILGFIDRTVNPAAAQASVYDSTGARIRDWYLAHAWAQNEYPAFLLSNEEIVSVGPTNSFKIDVASTAAQTEYLDILGIIVEALGKTITKEPSKLLTY